MTEVKIPPQIAPHEGRELNLMRRGLKHVALFFELRPLDFAGFVESGFHLIEFEQFAKQNQIYNTYIFYRSGYEDAAKRLKEIAQDISKGIDLIREHEIGRILGYTRDQVEAFIAQAVRN